MSLLWAVTELAAPLSAAAQAEDRAVVLVMDPGMPALVHRLREEIESLGLEAHSVRAKNPDESLEQRARAEGALAAIRITPRGEGFVEMTIVDRATGKTVTRRLAIELPSDPASAELVATRTIELLRASLMELTAAHPPRGEVQAPERVTELASAVADDRGGFTPSLALGPAAVMSPGLSTSADVSLALNLLWNEQLGVTAQALLPLSASRFSTREGDVELSPTLYRLGAVFALPLASSVSLRPQAGVLLARVSLVGSAEPPYASARDDVTAAGPWFALALGFELTRSVSTWVAADAAVMMPRTVVRAAGREVADWGRPLVSTALGLEFFSP